MGRVVPVCPDNLSSWVARGEDLDWTSPFVTAAVALGSSKSEKCKQSYRYLVPKYVEIDRGVNGIEVLSRHRHSDVLSMDSSTC